MAWEERGTSNRALNLSEIEEIRDLFVTAAVRAKELECEGIVLHGSTSTSFSNGFPHGPIRGWTDTGDF
jgi:2,4-dienoyl-CoA reductase-like NADH-dependent reductase (Old Yellow Enzyme family)